MHCKNGTTTDYAEDLKYVMQMYNLFEYSLNYFHTTGSSWLHSEDETANFNGNITGNDNFNSFKYNTKLVKTVVDNNNSKYSKKNSKKCNKCCTSKVSK